MNVNFSSYYCMQADKVEEAEDGADGNAAGGLGDLGADGGGGAMLASVDEKSNAVAVINSVGTLQVINHNHSPFCACLRAARPSPPREGDKKVLWSPYIMHHNDADDSLMKRCLPCCCDCIP